MARQLYDISKMRIIKHSIKSSKGFTLMELVVTTAIMGTLAAVSGPKFAEQQEEAKVRTTLVNISIIGQTMSTDFQNRLTRQGMKEAKFSSPINSPVILANDSTDIITTRLIRQMEPIPVSPYNDMPYVFTLIRDGEVKYIPVPGSINIDYTGPKFTIHDQNDPINLIMEFSP